MLQKCNTKNDMILKTLTNKLSCRVGPWILNQPLSSIKEKALLKTLPEDIDFVESCVFDYNKFHSRGKTGCVSLHFLLDLTSVFEIVPVQETKRKISGNLRLECYLSSSNWHPDRFSKGNGRFLWFLSSYEKKRWIIST